MTLLYPAEKLILGVMSALLLATVVLISTKGIAFDPAQFNKPAVATVVIFAFAMALRRFQVVPQLALACVMFGSFSITGLTVPTFNTALLPRPIAPIDGLLVQMDALVGYHWPQWCAWFAERPALNGAIRFLYIQTMMAMIVALAFLCVVDNRKRLHVGLLACMFTSLITLAFWSVFPSSGAAAYWTLPAGMEEQLGLISTTANGRQLNEWLANGVTEINRLNVGGLVGIPSYHTVMALMPVYLLWPYKILRFVTIPLAIAAMPGILVHGGHNLMDIFAGIAVIVAGWALAARALRYLERNMASPETPMPVDGETPHPA